MRIVQLTTDNREPFKDHANPQPWFGTAPEALLQGFAQLPEVEVHVVCCLRQPVHSPAKLADNVWYHSLVVPKWGWMTTGFQGCIRAVRGKLRELKPDIVHGQGTEREAAICAVLSGRPNVLTIHGNMRLIVELNRFPPFSYNWLAARLETVALARTCGVVCITHYTQSAVADLAKKTWLLPNAVDGAFFEIESRPAQSKRILCIGNVCYRKNQIPFIRALDALAKELSFEVVFLGDGARHTEYGVEFFELLKSRPWCRWGGMASRAELRQHLRDAAAVVLPSLEDNCPMVILEGAAAGVPVAGGRVGGVPDLIEHERTGLLFNPTDPADMARCVRRLIQSRPEALAWADAARKVARDRFHPVTIARKHLDIYREVLQHRQKDST